MSRHILKCDLAQYSAGSIITIPDEESSFLIKGKGYYIQIFRDCEKLLLPKLPDLFIQIKNKPINSINHVNNWSIFKLLEYNSESNLANVPYGSYMNVSFCNSKKAREVMVTSYGALNNNDFYQPIDLIYQSDIKSGDLVVRIHEDGRKIKGIALTNRESITIGGLFNRFLSLENSLEYQCLAGENYSSQTNNFYYYQPMKQEELNQDDIHLITGLLISGLKRPNIQWEGYLPKLGLDVTQMKIVSNE